VDVQSDDYDINDIEDDYDYYHSRPVSRLAQKTFSFTVKDSLVNVGPITDIDISESTDHASTSTSETNSRKANIEIVTTTGYAKGGSLSIIQVCILSTPL
jgi:cleavage and polyadenylation specificity factor subunit 1